MTITILLFAGLAERANVREIELTLPEQATVRDLLQAVGEQYPALAPLLGSCFVSMNHEYAAFDRVISPDDEIALLPPVSGGEEVPRFAITREPLSADQLVRLVKQPARRRHLDVCRNGTRIYARSAHGLPVL